MIMAIFVIPPLKNLAPARLKTRARETCITNALEAPFKSEIRIRDSFVGATAF